VQGGRRKGAAAAVTREQIVDVAETLAREVGLDGVTARRIAAELGVTAAALYWHVAGKQDIVRSLVDRASARTERPPASFGNWRDRLAQFYVSTREQFTAYAGLSAALITAEPTAATMTNCLYVLDLLRDAGFSEPAALEVFDALSILSLGHLVMLDTARFNARQARDEAIGAYAARVHAVLQDNPEYAVFVRALVDFDDDRSRTQLIRSIDLVLRSAAADAGVAMPHSKRFALAN
jgi:AcrR family transcriptional regulator